MPNSLSLFWKSQACLTNFLQDVNEGQAGAFSIGSASFLGTLISGRVYVSDGVMTTALLDPLQSDASLGVGQSILSRMSPMQNKSPEEIRISLNLVIEQNARATVSQKESSVSLPGGRRQ